MNLDWVKTGFGLKQAQEQPPPPYRPEAPQNPLAAELDRHPFGNDVPTWLLVELIGPGPDFDALKIEDWTAVLRIVTRDLPSLMKKGLHFDESNFKKEEGCMLPGPGFMGDVVSGVQGIKSRRYVLSDTGDDPQWFGQLLVQSPTISTLSRFRVQQLSPKKIYMAVAFNHRDEKVYFWACNSSDNNFNVIYDDLEMDGFWPQQRCPSTELAEIHRHSGESTTATVIAEQRISTNFAILHISTGSTISGFEPRVIAVWSSM
ncbi:Actin-binding FH2 [Paramyrothecium foliicola]|nr:Actin-binding FH2 [Paramyrothecium foliicola]